MRLFGLKIMAFLKNARLQLSEPAMAYFIFCLL